MSSLGKEWLQQDSKEKGPHDAQAAGFAQAQSFPESVRVAVPDTVLLDRLIAVWDTGGIRCIESVL